MTFRSSPVDLLLPRPQEIRVQDRGTAMPRRLRVSAAPGTDERRIVAALDPALGLLRRSVKDTRLGTAQPGPERVLLALEPDSGSTPESYSLDVSPNGILLRAPAPAGLFYGLTTLGQWLAAQSDGSDQGLTSGRIRDRPDFAARGVMLDISRDRVPRMSTLYALIDRLASWKVNQLQLYMEHTFAYPGHEQVWRGSSPMTAEQIRSLDAYCRERYIQLVPNQNSFGHLHRWLKHDRYRGLAECPEGIEHPFSDRVEPFSLCPTDPAALDFLAELYDALLPCFSSRLFNAGCDETLDLGRCRSAAACKELGRRAVYLEFLRSIQSLAEERGRRLQCWADVLLEDAELPELDHGFTPLVWGYEAGHPFDRELARIATTGCEFYVCPGTSSWNSLAGRWRNARHNLAAAARAGRDHGASGYLITDWGDNGHLQPRPVSYPGLACGAAFAWNVQTAEAPEDPDWAALLDRHAFGAPPHRGPATELLRLADSYTATGVELKNTTVLFPLLLEPEARLTESRFADLTPEGLAATRHEIATARRERAEPASDLGDLGLVLRELDWIAGLLTLACDLGEARLQIDRAEPITALPSSSRRELRERLEPLIRQHRSLWLARSRPGGRKDSLRRLRRLQEALGAHSK